MAKNTMGLREICALLVEALKFRISYRLGSFAKHAITRYENFNRIVEQSDYDYLPPEKLQWLLSVQRDQVDDKAQIRTDSWQIRNIDDATNHYAVVAKEAALNMGGIQVVAHIGARVDVISAYLAGRFPDRQFTSIDLQKNLAEHNRFLPQQPNWRFEPGYAIDIFEAGFNPDMMIAMYTLCKMTKREVIRTIKAANARKLVILSSYKPGVFWLDPDGLADSELSATALMEPELKKSFFTHNYKAILTALGYRIEKSVVVPSFTGIRDGGGHLVVAEKIAA